VPKSAENSHQTESRTVSPKGADAPVVGTRRPERLADFVGQRRVLSNLQVMLEAAAKREVALEHILLAGPPGLGKTTLAHIIAREMKIPITVSAGPLLERAGDLVAILTSLKPRQVLFIDEVHRLPRPVEETLYGAMEDYRVDVIIGKGPGARTIPLRLNPFTLVGATTRSGLLTAPLRDRFGALFHLTFYSQEELEEILRRRAAEEKISISAGCLASIAAKSRGTPRVALRLLKRVWDFAIVAGKEEITEALAENALKQLGISAEGLDEMDRRILTTMLRNFQGGPVGIDTIAAVLNEERDTIEEVYEPYLLKAGFLEKTSRGRVATQKTFDYFKVPYEPGRFRPGAEVPLFENPAEEE